MRVAATAVALALATLVGAAAATADRRHADNSPPSTIR
jgi:hypothetical protein